MKVKLYSKPDCVKCDATKRWLDRRGVEYTVIDMADDPEALAYVKDLGALGAPVVELEDGTWWADYRVNLLEEHFPKG